MGLLASLVLDFEMLDWSPLQHCEFFAGEMAVTYAEMEAGRKALAFDIIYDDVFMDFNSGRGFAHALYQVLRLGPGSGLMMAPVCSSWVFMSRGTTRRRMYAALGDLNSRSVSDGNVMASRVAIILYLAAARGVWFVFEQPVGSLFQEHPRLQQLFGILNIHRKQIRMKDFGGPSEKPTWLYSNHHFIGHLDQFKPINRALQLEDIQVSVHYKTPDGKERVTAGKDLKKSQTYPLAFGRAMAKLRSVHSSLVKKDIRRRLRRRRRRAARAGSTSEDVLGWLRDAKLRPVIKFLRGAMGNI